MAGKTFRRTTVLRAQWRAPIDKASSSNTILVHSFTSAASMRPSKPASKSASHRTKSLKMHLLGGRDQPFPRKCMISLTATALTAAFALSLGQPRFLKLTVLKSWASGKPKSKAVSRKTVTRSTVLEVCHHVNCYRHFMGRRIPQSNRSCDPQVR